MFYNKLVFLQSDRQKFSVRQKAIVVAHVFEFDNVDFSQVLGVEEVFKLIEYAHPTLHDHVFSGAPAAILGANASFACFYGHSVLADGSL